VQYRRVEHAHCQKRLHVHTQTCRSGLNPLIRSHGRMPRDSSRVLHTSVVCRNTSKQSQFIPVITFIQPGVVNEIYDLCKLLF
jgi:hypothetical protein